MTSTTELAKAKASLLVLKFMAILGHKPSEAKLCASLLVDEILNTFSLPIKIDEIAHYQEVKRQIENL